MGLVFTLYPDEPRNDFYVGDTRVTLEKIRHEANFQIKVHGEALDQLHNVTDQRTIEIIPRVRVSAGTKREEEEEHCVAIVIEAPRAIAVHRGNTYRNIQREKRNS